MTLKIINVKITEKRTLTLESEHSKSQKKDSMGGEIYFDAENEEYYFSHGNCRYYISELKALSKIITELNKSKK